MEDTDQRLDTTDAEFVDVIHTNSGPLYIGALSFPNNIGHIDFYPNGGTFQRGCGVLFSLSIFSLSGKKILISTQSYCLINLFHFSIILLLIIISEVFTSFMCSGLSS